MKKIKKALIGILIAFCFVFIASNDYKANQYTMKKGDRTIVFQGMIHYADKSFYDLVNAEIKHYKDKGFSHYYEMVNLEGVSKEDFNKFAKMPDVPFEKMGIVNQSDYLNLEEDDTNADVNAKEFIELKAPANFISNQQVYTEIFPRSMVFGIKASITIEETLSGVYSILNKERPQHLKNVFLTLHLGVEKAKYINDTRNDILIKHIDSTDKNLFITYGEAHFTDFRNKMEKKGWKIIKEKKIMALDNMN